MRHFISILESNTIPYIHPVNVLALSFLFLFAFKNAISILYVFTSFRQYTD